MHLKSQMNKENIASQFVFFSITHKSSLKVSFHELRTHFFFFRYFFQRFSEKKRKMDLWGTPCQDEHEHFQMSFLLSFRNFSPSNA